MAKKPYSPMASYEVLKEVEQKLNQAATADDVARLVTSHGTKVGYKAFCYMLSGKMSAAAMKPNDACTDAATLEQEGNIEEALAIYKAVLAVHPTHPMAVAKVAELG